MANNVPANRARIPSLGTALLACAVIVAVWMLITEMMIPDSRFQDLSRLDPVDRLQRITDLTRLGSEGVPVLVRAISDPNPNVRSSALVGLGKIGPCAIDAIELVRQRLTDDAPRVRSSAAMAYWHISQDPRVVVPTLIPMIDDSNAEVRDAAIVTLIEIGRRAERPFIDMLCSDSEEIRAPAWRVFRHSVFWGSAKKADETIRELLDHPNHDVHTEALISTVFLANSNWGSMTVANVRELIQVTNLKFAVNLSKNAQPTIEDIVLDAIGGLNAEGAEMLPTIVELIDGQDPLEIGNSAHPTSSDYTVIDWATRRTSRDRFVYILHPRFERLLTVVSNLRTAAMPAAPSLIRRMKELHVPNRTFVVKTLFEIGCDPETLVPDLIAIVSELADQRTPFAPWNAQQAATLLMRVNPDEALRQVPVLIPKIGTIETEINGNALSILSVLGPLTHQAMPELIPLIRHPNPVVQMNALRSLAGSDSESAYAVAPLVARLEDESADHPPETNQRIIQLLGQIGPAAKPAIPSLLKLIEFDAFEVAPVDFSVRQMAYSTLEQIGGSSSDVFAVLRARSTRPTSRHSIYIHDRVMAIRVLASIGSTSDSVLEDLMTSLFDESEPVRVQAALAIGAMHVNRRAAVKPLILALADASPYVKASAVLALRQIGHDARPAIPIIKALEANRVVIDPAWYLKLFQFDVPPMWYKPTKEFEEQTFESFIESAVSTIESTNVQSYCCP